MPPRMRQMLALWFTLAFCYSYVLPRWADWSQNSRLDLVLALADEGSVRIDRYVANTGDYAFYQGHAYSDKAPGPAFLALPIYIAMQPVLNHSAVRERAGALGGGAAMGDTLQPGGTGLRDDKLRLALAQYLLTVLVVSIPAASLGVLLFAALKRLGVRSLAAGVGSLAYGLGSAAAPYSGNFYSHQLVAALIFAAFFVAASFPTNRSQLFPARSLLCGLLLGWATISEYPAALAGAIIGVYALWRHGPRWLAPMAIGAALPLALMAVYDYVAFGTPMPVGYTYSALWQGQHHTGFMSLTAPHPDALWGLSFGSFRGLFIRAPWLLLAFPGYALWWRSGRQRAELWVAALIPLAIYVFYSSSAMWWGGFAAGPRYIVPLLPFLALPAAWCIAAMLARRDEAILVAALVLASAGLTWAEALAGQQFPPDSVRATWAGYVLPAWAHNDIARNLGMALGLRGPASLLPLIVAAAIGVALVLPWPRSRHAPRPDKAEATYA